MSAGKTRVVAAALSVNLAIAVFKFIAAVLSRSTAMLAEAVHSTADCLNQILLFVGLRRSARPANPAHPFGHGLESFFWSFLVAVCIFAVGGGVSIDEGVRKILHPADAHQLGDVRWAYAVLGVSLLLESLSLKVAVTEFQRVRAGRPLRQALAESRNPTVVLVLFEDLAALFGLVVALCGVAAYDLTGNPVWDGLASVVVGLALCGVGWYLGRESLSLMMLESATEDNQRRMLAAVQAHPAVRAVVHQRTIHLGPEEILAAVKVRFAPELTTAELERVINEVEAAMRVAVPQLRRIYIEPGFDERAASAAGAGLMATRSAERRFVITPLRSGDLDSLMDVERLSFRAPWSRQVFVEELGRDWAYVDVVKAASGGDVLAFINYWLVRDEVHVLNLACHPDQRRLGHGARLLGHVVDFAVRHSCRYVTLEVRRSNTGAIQLYRNHGFRPVGIRPNYYVEENEDAIVMLLELQPES